MLLVDSKTVVPVEVQSAFPVRTRLQEHLVAIKLILNKHDHVILFIIFWSMSRILK
jgi:hypothetical protein